jgi:hypothetical protein
MKKLVFGLFLASSLLLPLSASAAGGGTVHGKQYLVLGGGPRPIADNSIAFIPCNPDDECKKIESNLVDAVDRAPEDRDKLEAILKVLRNDLPSGGRATQKVKTDYDGNYSFVRPTSECLIISTGTAGLAYGVWIKAVNPNSKVDLMGSNAVFVMNKSKG